MRWSLGRQLAAGFAVPLVILAVVGGLAYRTLHHTLATSDWVEHTHEVQETAQELYGVVADLESQHRTFVFTGDEESLAEYVPLVSRATETYRHLAGLIPDNPIQLRRVTALWASIEQKIASQQKRVDVRRAKGLDAALAAVPLTQTIQARDAINRQFAEFAEEETRLLKERTQANTESAQTTQAVIIWGSVGGVLLAGLVALLITHRLTGPIRAGIQKIASSAGEILAATAEQASSTQEEATAVQETTTTVHEVRQTAQLSAQKAQAVVDTGRKSTQAADDGLRAVEETLAGMRQAKGRMEGIAERVLTLSEQGLKIAEIIATVGNLAEQSNLLAVNAAIEAAKAGEAGRGFAVVASEVKGLAEQSKQATGQVRQILGEVQRATQAAVLATEQGVKASEAGEELARRAGDAIQLLATSLEESAQAAQQILATSREQAAGVDQVATAMDNIRQVAVQNLAATRQMESAARDLNTLALQFHELLSGENGGPRPGSTARIAEDRA